LLDKSTLDVCSRVGASSFQIVRRDLGDNYGNVTQTALQNQAEFDTLGPETGGLLRGLFEMRVRDLQTTLEHTLAMQEVVLLLTEGDPARP
jgi:hypothetical protein